MVKWVHVQDGTEMGEAERVRIPLIRPRVSNAREGEGREIDAGGKGMERQKGGIGRNSDEKLHLFKKQSKVQKMTMEGCGGKNIIKEQCKERLIKEKEGNKINIVQ